MWIEDRVNEIKNNAEAQCRPEEVLPQVLVLAAWTLFYMVTPKNIPKKVFFKCEKKA